MQTATIYDAPLGKIVHAPTIVELRNGSFMVAWFGGKNEGTRDTCIYGMIDDMRNNDPLCLAGSKALPNYMFYKHPHWNPVLYLDGSEVVLNYKTGPSPRQWHAYEKRSIDGVEWSEKVALPAGILGPVRAKPLLVGRRIACGTSVETHESWACYIDWHERNRWVREGPIQDADAIQPVLWQIRSGQYGMFMRPNVRRRNETRLLTSTSYTPQHQSEFPWHAACKTTIPNPGSAIDIVDDGADGLVLVINDSETTRDRLSLMFSTDRGEMWTDPCLLPFSPKFPYQSYPAAILDMNANLHVAFSMQRKAIVHVQLSEDEWKGKRDALRSTARSRVEK